MLTTRQVAFRLSDSLIVRLDEYVARLRLEQQGLKVTRADAVRMLLTKGLEGERPPRQPLLPGVPVSAPPRRKRAVIE